LKGWLTSGADSPIRDAQDQQQAGDWQRITSFDRENGHIMDKSKPSYANNLNYLAAGYGYWIKMNRPGYLVMKGKKIPASTTRQLPAGWNLVGPTSLHTCYYQGSALPPQIQETPAGVIDPQAVADMKQWLTSGADSPIRDSQDPQQAGDWQRITSFDRDNGHIMDKSKPAYANNLNYLATGYGFWIKMNRQGRLAMGGGE
jgi:hypothetical protein